MKDVENFLIKNGFENNLHTQIFSNDKCQVTIFDKYYEVYTHKYDTVMFSPTLQIYWLIGVLTYYDLIDKNYIK
jgi:hypothetical protein